MQNECPQLCFCITIPDHHTHTHTTSALSDALASRSSLAVLAEWCEAPGLSADFFFFTSFLITILVDPAEW